MDNRARTEQATCSIPNCRNSAPAHAAFCRIHSSPGAKASALGELERDFRQRAHACRTNADAFSPEAASVWDLAADAVRDFGKAL